MVGPLVLWLSDDTAWIRVVGNGNFICSPEMKDFIRNALARGYRDFAIDLAECPLMDSTFMGTLAYIALRLRELANAGEEIGKIRILNCNVLNRDLLRKLGLDKLFKM